MKALRDRILVLFGRPEKPAGYDDAKKEAQEAIRNLESRISREKREQESLRAKAVKDMFDKLGGHGV